MKARTPPSPIMTRVASVALLCVSTLAPLASAANDMVNIYSARKEALILPLLERFKADTGIGFRLITGKADGLLQRACAATGSVQ